MCKEDKGEKDSRKRISQDRDEVTKRNQETKERERGKNMNRLKDRLTDRLTNWNQTDH